MKLQYICANRNHIIILYAPNDSLFFFYLLQAYKYTWISYEVHVEHTWVLTWFSREKAAANGYVRTTWISRLSFYLGISRLSITKSTNEAKYLQITAYWVTIFSTPLDLDVKFIVTHLKKLSKIWLALKRITFTIFFFNV